MPSSVLILGLGNPLRGDDGIGCRLVEEMACQELPPGVQVLDGGAAGLGLLNLVEGWERIVIVDAAEMGRRPGEFVRFTPDDVRLASTPDRFSFHHAGLGEALALADALGRPLPGIVIFGVQPASVGWGEGLSPDVEAALPALIAVVLKEATNEER
ncbi:MAG: hydrogenase maturation protease [Chloroflexota bacterium]|nr:hydrogenase maturation protease [Chloroflexota bacterium]